MKKALTAACAVTTLVVLSAQDVSAWTKTYTTYSGRATIAEVNLLNLAEVTVVDTGPLPSTGGSLSKSLPIIDVLGLISAEALQVETSGGSKVAKSKARLVELDVGPIDLGKLPVLSGILGDLNLLQRVPLLPVANNLLGNLLGGLLGNVPVVGNLINLNQPLELDISADIVESSSRASCSNKGKPQLGGSSYIAELNISGQFIDVTGEPNQTVDVLGGLVKIVINDQKKSISSGAGAIDVSALHIISPAADIVLSHAHSDIRCG